MLAINPANQKMAVVSSIHSEISLLNTAGRMQALTGAGYSTLAFSPDGQQLAAAATGCW